MELSRRDVLVALAATGTAGGLGVVAVSEAGTGPLTDHEVATLVAVAEVVYPSAVTGVEAFVRDYSVARVDADGAYREGVRDAIGALDEAATDWFGAPVTRLGRATRHSALRQVGAIEATPDPDGVRGERIRYFVVDELLYAFYTAPTGAGLAGLENPPGYPGGDASYARGPPT